MTLRLESADLPIGRYGRFKRKASSDATSYWAGHEMYKCCIATGKNAAWHFGKMLGKKSGKKSGIKAWYQGTKKVMFEV